MVTSGSLVRMSKRRKPSYITASSSPGVADPVDAPGFVVRDQQRAVGHHEHVRGPTGRGAALEPADGKGLVGRRAPAFELHERDAVADRRRAVPGAVLRDEDAAAVLLGEHAAGVEAHTEAATCGPSSRAGAVNSSQARPALFSGARRPSPGQYGKAE